MNYLEHIDKKRVEQLIKKDDVDDDLKKQLKSYLRKYDYKKGGSLVEYENKGIGRGRKYAKGSLSLPFPLILGSKMYSCGMFFKN